MTSQEQIEPYGKFIILNEDQKQKFAAMTEQELEFMSSVIARNLNDSIHKMENVFKEIKELVKLAEIQEGGNGN